MRATLPRLLGAGYAIPAKIRKNDDLIFDWLIKNPPRQNPFVGYEERRVLGAHENLIDIMVPAALNAMQAAQLNAADVHMLLGCGSVGSYWNPNELTLLHQRLGLPQSTWVIALNNEFANFSASLFFADALIRAGRIENALIVAGANWTRHVDYKTPQSASAGDGAGAAVMGLSADPCQFCVVDQETVTLSQYFGSMFMLGTPDTLHTQQVWGNPVFQINEQGLEGFKTCGIEAAPQAVLRLLERHNLSPQQIGLIGHQASQSLFDAWIDTIGLPPHQLIQTIKQFANMTVANNAVNLAYASTSGRIPFDHLVLLSLGPDMHANALLLARG